MITAQLFNSTAPLRRLFHTFMLILLVLMSCLSSVKGETWADNLSTDQCKGVFLFNVSASGLFLSFFPCRFHLLYDMYRLAYSTTSSQISTLDGVVEGILNGLIPRWVDTSCRVCVSLVSFLFSNASLLLLLGFFCPHFLYYIVCKSSLSICVIYCSNFQLACNEERSMYEQIPNFVGYRILLRFVCCSVSSIHAPFSLPLSLAYTLSIRCCLLYIEYTYNLVCVCRRCETHVYIYMT